MSPQAGQDLVDFYAKEMYVKDDEVGEIIKMYSADNV
jgi:hypothetical protein